MALTVKNKIWIGTFFLFLLLILTGGTSMFYIAQLKEERLNVLKDNYESLAYCHNMQQALNDIKENASAATTNFESNLKNQEANITEPGEKASHHCITFIVQQNKTRRYRKENF